MSKQIVGIICLFLAGACGGCGAMQRDFVIVKDGTPNATIIIARAADLSGVKLGKAEEAYRNRALTVADAAKDLQSYIRKITGAELLIAYDDQDVQGNLILVGASRYTTELGLTNEDLADQEHIVRTTGRHLVLMGRDEPYELWVQRVRNATFTFQRGLLGPIATSQPVGTHYAVAEFLHRSCGVRWYFPGEIGEVVPNQSTLAIAPIDLRRTPSTRFRIVNRDLIPQKYYFEERLIQPGVSMWANAPHLADTAAWGRHLKIGGESFACNHSLYGYYEKFKDTHPEYWGPRGPKKERMLCLSEPGMLQQVVADARAFYDGQRTGQHQSDRFFSVVPMDNETWCQCDDCKPQYQVRRRESDGKEIILRSNYVWKFVAEVARQVSETHPDAVITNVAYRSYFEPPDADVVKLPDNVEVQI
ncbi:MAG: DUF4838 domain-containing protein [Phycisphaeraceae bacterium]|nr:DUF4838 domain-containing protein [Phycisphaeraceae bacterium]